MIKIVLRKTEMKSPKASFKWSGILFFKGSQNRSSFPVRNVLIKKYANLVLLARLQLSFLLHKKTESGSTHVTESNYIGSVPQIRRALDLIEASLNAKKKKRYKP